MYTHVYSGTGGGSTRNYQFNTIAVQEVVVDTGAAGADTRSGGAIEVADNSKPAQSNQGEVAERQTPTGNRVAPDEIE